MLLLRCPRPFRLRARVEAADGMPVRRWIGLATELAAMVEGKGE